MIVLYDVHVSRAAGIEMLHVGRATYVMADDRPFLLDGATVLQHPAPTFPVTPDSPTGPSLELRRNGVSAGTVDLQALQDKWLEDEARWGGHAAVNQFRYEENRGGVIPDLTQLLPMADGDAAGVLSFRQGDQSNLAITWQALVRLHAKPFSVEWLHVLAPSGGMFGLYMPKPMFVSDGKQFCVNGQEIDALEADGGLGPKWAALNPTEQALGLCGGRWYIGRNLDQKTQAYVATDLLQRTTFDLYACTGPAPMDFSPVLQGTPNPFSPYLLFSLRQGDYNSDAENYFTIHVPDGKKVLLQGPATKIAGPYAVSYDLESLAVFSAATGRRVR